MCQKWMLSNCTHYSLTHAVEQNSKRRMFIIIQNPSKSDQRFPGRKQLLLLYCWDKTPTKSYLPSPLSTAICSQTYLIFGKSWFYNKMIVWLLRWFFEVFVFVIFVFVFLQYLQKGLQAQNKKGPGSSQGNEGWCTWWAWDEFPTSGKSTGISGQNKRRAGFQTVN